MKLIDSKFFKYLLLFFFVFTLVWAGFMMVGIQKFSDAAGTGLMLDTQPGVTANDVYQYMDRIGEDGRKTLISFYHFEDFVFPIAYGLFFFLAINYYLRKCFPKKKALLLLSLFSFFMVACDYTENFSIINIAESYPNKIPVVNYIGTITLVKWLVGLVCGICMIVPFGIFVWRKYIMKTKSQQG